MKKEFLLKGFDCPNCAVKVEKEVGALKGVHFSSMNLMKQTLTVVVDEGAFAEVEKQVEKIVHSHEPHVEVVLADREREIESHQGDDSAKKQIIRMALGAFIYAMGIAAAKLFSLAVHFELALFIAAYVVLGADVVISAVKNLIKGRVFDENFLMSLSTVGAFAIGEYPEAVAVMLFYQVGEFFQDRAVMRSRRSIAQLMDIRPDTAAVSRNGELLTVPPETVQVGETIVIKPGEKIPLDGIVLTGDAMLDTKALTGESVPRYVRCGDEVFSACINKCGMLSVRVTRGFEESTASRIIDLVENASDAKAPTENFITTFARYYTPFVVILAAALAVLPPLLFAAQWSDWMRRAFVFLVVSCPCALVISIPLAFFGGIGAASRHGVLVKGGNYLEALNSVKTVVFDKTGTLTKGVFTVSEIFPREGFALEEVLKWAAMAQTYSNHPIARSILAAYGGDTDGETVNEYKEIPGCGVSAAVGGRRILAGNEKLMHRENISYTPCERVGTKVYVSVDNCFAGCILIADSIKSDSDSAVAALKRMGIEKTVMLTGDDEKIAASVAAELGIDEYYAQLLPEGKVAMLEQLENSKRSGTKLAFVGDGINDAPVLARADVGIAMGALGSDAAIEAADVVLMTDEPTKLVEAIGVAKATKQIVVQNIVFALAIKAGFLILGAFGIAGMWEAVFADVGVAVIAVLNSMRALKK